MEPLDDPFLSVEDIQYQYSKRSFSLENVSFSLNSGKILVILGPSGSGKSTLLQIIAGLIRADAGKMTMHNKLIHHLQPENRGISMVFQKPYLLPFLTVGQNVEVGLKLQGKSKAYQKEKALIILEKVGMKEFYDRPISSLSGGQEQRIALARAIVLNPKLLLLDEPFSQLDPMLRQQMGEWLSEIRNEFKLSMIMVTHDRDEALMLGDQFLLLHEGKSEFLGDLQQIYYKPNSVWTAKFMGFDNIIKGIKKGHFVDTTLGRMKIHSELNDLPDGELLVTIRSEWIEIQEADHASSVKGEISSAKFTGSHMEIKLFVQDEHITIIQMGYHPYQQGSTLHITCDQTEVWCLSLKED